MNLRLGSESVPGEGWWALAILVLDFCWRNSTATYILQVKKALLRCDRELWVSVQEPADMRADVFHSDVVLQLGFWSTRSAISKDVCHLVKVPWWHWVDRPVITGFWGVQWRDVHFRCMFMLARPGIQTSIKCLSSYWLQPVMYSSKNFGV